MTSGVQPLLAADQPRSRPVFASVTSTANRWFTFLAILGADTLAFVCASGIAILLRYWSHGQFSLIDYFRFVPALAVFQFCVFLLMSLYPGILLHPADELRRIVKACTGVYIVIITITVFLRESTTYSRVVYIVAWVLTIILVLLYRKLARLLFANKSWWGVPALILGAGETGRHVVNNLMNRPSQGLRPVAILDDDPLKHNQVINGIPVLGSLDLAPEIATTDEIDYVIVAMPSVPGRAVSQMMEQYTHCFAHLLIIPDLLGMSSVWVSAKDVGGVLGIEVAQTLMHRVPQFIKRCFDFAICIAGSTVVLPLVVVIGLLIRFTSKGPVFYGQRRIGQHKRPFTALKFRSMILNSDQVLRVHLEANTEVRREWEQTQKLRKDPRITLVGKFIRKTSLDELPQLWNVLRGEMSLVGPRPIVSSEISRYGEQFDLYCKVRPGLTGLWQVSGRNNTTYAERVRYDEFYVRNWSVWLDLYILCKTIKTVMFGEGAY